MSDQLSNWAGNLTYNAARVYYPETVEQVQELVRSSDKIKALGSRHSFHNVADTVGNQISLERFDPSVAIDSENNTVTVSAGLRYGQVCAPLQQVGYALHNLASLPHISVAGACATGTHGSGDKNGSLATAVAGLELVNAAGELVTLSREQDGEKFLGAVVGLGGLGVITKVTLGVVPAFEIRQNVYEKLPLAQLGECFDEIMSSAYSVSLFTDWQSDWVNQVWLKQRVNGADPFEAAPELFGATLAQLPHHPIDTISAESCTQQLGVPGPWYERLPHFRMEFTPSVGEELQSEYLLPREHAVAALRAIYGLRDQLAPLLLISEVRSVAADDLWLSMCYQQDSIGIHFTWKRDWPNVSRLLPLIEEQLAPFNARPHWGKLFTMEPERLQALYPKLSDFQNLLSSFDPSGKFRNSYLDKYIFAAS